jgi:hypothetical protein
MKLDSDDSAVHWDRISTEDKKVTATFKSGKKVMLCEKGRFR